MYASERFHRYPRQLTFLLEGLSATLVVVAIANFGAVLLRGIWDMYGRDDALLDRFAPLAALVAWIDGGPRIRADYWLDFLPTLVPSLSWLALALLLAIVLRNALPAVRIDTPGVLVEFAGHWLPIPWSELRAVKVTSDVAGTKFVLLAESDPRRLTGWHRIYSLLYGRGLRPGFYITSNISNFDNLLKGMIDESERTSRAFESVQALRVEEDAPSPIFRLILSPASFFSSQTAGEASVPATISPGAPVRAVYPGRITAIINAVLLLLIIFAALAYLSYWVRTLALLFPGLRFITPFAWNLSDPQYIELYNAFRTRGVPFFGVEGRPDLPTPFWLLVSAHLMLALAWAALMWLRNLLPALESRKDGILVRINTRWQLIPWAKIKAFKASEISEQSQVLLLQSPLLPRLQTLTSRLYDGSSTPGVLITSAIGAYQPFLQSVLPQLAALDQSGENPILQQDARSPLAFLALRRRDSLNELVSPIKDDPATKQIDNRLLLAAGMPILALATLPALMLLVSRLLAGDSTPSFGILLGVFVLWFFALLEWPLVALISLLLDDNTGGGEEGYRALYVYPASQLPRLLPMTGALILTIVGAPILPGLAWIAAIVWAYWLAGGLFEQLYEWTGTQIILGGLLPVVWQLLLLLGYLVAVS
ncbi:MAG: hypothetical protein HC822_21970 [Oscillochloris sp.]|nr:hypothetical protein [Oscillochloris sp.]